MHLNIVIYSCVGLLCLLSPPIFAAPIDFKTEFADQLRVALKQYNTELLETNLKDLEQLYRTLSEELPLNEEQQRTFKNRLESIQILEQRIDAELSATTIKSVIDFGNSMILELLLVGTKPELKNDEAKLMSFKNALTNVAQRELANLLKFVHQIHGKWTDLYATIPADILAAEPTYKKINEKVQQLPQIELNSTLMFTEILEIMDTFAQFFGFTEWQPILAAEKNINNEPEFETISLCHNCL